jgi:hypothetical protein
MVRRHVIKNGKICTTSIWFKIAESKTMEQAGKSVTQTTSFGDYRAVKGVKVPYNMIQNVGFELDIKYQIKINEG